MTITASAAEHALAGQTAPRLAVIQLGQAGPDSPFVKEISHWLPAGTEVVNYGGLDGVEGDELDAVRARPEDARVLVASLADESSIVLSEERLLPYLESAIARAEADGDVALMVCTGAFPPLAHNKTLVFPDAAIGGTLDALVPKTSTLGVLCPLPEQAEMISAKYTDWQKVCIESAMPSGPTAVQDAAEAAVRLRDAGASAVVMDCMGYTTDAAAAVKAATGLPVFLARRIAARVTSELL